MKLPEWLRESEKGVEIALFVAPRASRSRVVGPHDGRLKVQIAAPPVDGAANDAIITLFRRLLGVPKSDIEIGSGATGKRKLLCVTGINAQQVVEVVA